MPDIAMADLQFSIVAPKFQPHLATVFYIHGFGDRPFDIYVQSMVQRGELDHIKWVLPNASVIITPTIRGLAHWISMFPTDVTARHSDPEGWLM